MATRKKNSGSKKSNSSSKRKILLGVIISVAILLLVGSVLAWYIVFRSNVHIKRDKQFIYIKTGSTFEDVTTQIEHILDAPKTFIWVADWMNYTQKVKAGRYTIANGMSNRELISLLRSGKQEAVKVTIQTYNYKEDLAHAICKNLEADSIEFVQLMNDSAEMANYQITPMQALAIAIPNTYYFNWNTPADSVYKRLVKEYIKFWDDSRIAKAKARALSRIEVITLASIVAKETNKTDEMPEIACVYLNRLAKGMKLEADPTVKYAVGDMTLRRILYEHLETESPYNTYLIKGLPPGPICNPSIAAIDAVLNPAQSEFIYFCAKEDFSGHHNFACTLTEHNRNAAKFHKAMNARGIH